MVDRFWLEEDGAEGTAWMSLYREDGKSWHNGEPLYVAYADYEAVVQQCEGWRARYERIHELLTKAQDRADRLLTKLEQREP